MSIRKSTFKSTHKSRSYRQKSSPLTFERLEPRKVLAAFLPLATFLPGAYIGNSLGDNLANDSIVENATEFENQIGNTPMANSGVVGRHVFYNDSIYDGDDASATVEDDNAIATNKSPFFPGETAAFENYTSFPEGINGIIIDAFLVDPAGFTLNDLILSSGVGNQLSDFERLDVNYEVSVRAGDGLDGSDSITIPLPKRSGRLYLDDLEIAPSLSRLAAKTNNNQELRSAGSSDLTVELNQVANRLKVTPACLIYAGWAIMLSAITQKQDVIFGETTSGRHSDVRGWDAMAGCFAGSLPNRCKIAAHESLNELVQQIHHDSFASLPFRHLPLSEIQNCTDANGSNTLFESLVVVENLPWHDIEIESDGLSVHDYHAGITSTYPLTLVAKVLPPALFKQVK